MIDLLKYSWHDLASKYSTEHPLIEDCWQEIESHYTSKKRHYHNLAHVYSMLRQAESNKNQIHDFDMVSFAIWYHDIIYKPSKSNNEEKSADFAINRLKSFKIHTKRLNIVKNLILSTKAQELIILENKDNAYLLDFDLSILGTDWNVYQMYIENIRKEYAIYPDFIYNKGRKKVLNHFLQRENLYFTKSYKHQFEATARKNMKKELELL